MEVTPDSLLPPATHCVCVCLPNLCLCKQNKAACALGPFYDPLSWACAGFDCLSRVGGHLFFCYLAITNETAVNTFARFYRDAGFLFKNLLYRCVFCVSGVYAHTREESGQLVMSALSLHLV